MIGADRPSLDVVESVEASALAKMAVSGDSAPEKPPAQGRSLSTLPRVWTSLVSSFKVGDLVALRSDPSIQLPILEVIASGPECRYRVFQNNTKAIYYES